MCRQTCFIPTACDLVYMRVYVDFSFITSSRPFCWDSSRRHEFTCDCFTATSHLSMRAFAPGTRCALAAVVKGWDQLCRCMSGTKCCNPSVDVVEIASSRKRAWWDSGINRERERRNENIPALRSLTCPDVLIQHVSSPHGPVGNPEAKLCPSGSVCISSQADGKLTIEN